MQKNAVHATLTLISVRKNPNYQYITTAVINLQNLPHQLIE